MHLTRSAVSKFLFFAAVFTFTTLTASAQPSRNFAEAAKEGPNASAFVIDKWKFTLNGTPYEITKEGKISKNFKSGRKSAQLKIGADEELSRIVYYAQHEADLLILTEVQAGGDGASVLYRVDPGSLKTKWIVSIPGFNVANGLIEGNSVYLAAIGFVAKVELRNGRYAWKHDDLYRKYKKDGAFNIFETPKIEEDRIVFKEADTENQIVVSKVDGKVLNVVVR